MTVFFVSDTTFYEKVIEVISRLTVWDLCVIGCLIAYYILIRKLEQKTLPEI